MCVAEVMAKIITAIFSVGIEISATLAMIKQVSTIFGRSRHGGTKKGRCVCVCSVQSLYIAQ